MIQFWNGNKTAARQAHEYELVSELLSTREIHNDLTDYPNAEDESNIFHNGADLLVTVAGNPKFAPGTFIEVAPPLCFGLLGCRLLITRKIDVQFDHITQLELKQKIAGVPATWADATLLRDNDCTVLEEGDIEHILTSISQGNADYLSLGANEVHAVFDQFKSRFPRSPYSPRNDDLLSIATCILCLARTTRARRTPFKMHASYVPLG